MSDTQIQDEAVLRQVLVCTRCGDSLAWSPEKAFCCNSCGVSFPIVAGGSVSFIQNTPLTIMRSKPKAARVGSDWRRANNTFFRGVAEAFDPESLDLDIGAGDGHLRSIFNSRYIATDVALYPGLHFLCDLSCTSPLRPASFDAVILNNVLEHLKDPVSVLRAAASAMKSDGEMFITVPFIIKLHQVPFDVGRYTHYALVEMLTRAGLDDICVEVVYTPAALLRVFFHETFLPASRGWRGFLGSIAVKIAWLGVRIAQIVRRTESYRVVRLTRPDAEAPSAWVTGYQIRARKL